MEAHQTSNLRVAGSSPAMLAFLPHFLSLGWFLLTDSSPLVTLSLLLAFLFRYLTFVALSYTLWSFFILYSLIVLFFGVILVSWERSSVGRA